MFFTREKINKFISSRAVLYFSIFLLINVIAFLPSLNHITEILSHFKLHYFCISIVFLGIFTYLSFLNKKFIIGILISLILLVANLVELYPYFMRTNDVSFPNNIKIGLFNVLTQNKAFNKTINEINITNPDVLIMQEVDSKWCEELSQIKYKYLYSIEEPMEVNEGNFGIALYSKYPIEDYEIEEWSDYGIPVINALINKDNKLIRIFAVHTLPPLKKEYYKARNQMFENIKNINTQNTSLIIAGDFNSTAFSPSYKKYIKSKNMNDAQTTKGNIFEGSWNAYHPAFMRITVEHILSSTDLVPLQYKLGNKIYSDHFPVFVELGYN